MVRELTDHEITEWNKYRFRADLNNSFYIAELFDEKFLEKFMGNLSNIIKAPSEKVAVSIFIKRYAFVAVMSLYAMTVWNKKIDLSLDKLTMEIPEQGNDWLPSFSLKEVTMQDWNGTNRMEWRKRVFHDLFAENIFLLIEKFEKTFKISRLVLWENISVYLFWLYETELKDMSIHHITEDFHFLIFEAEGHLFGRYKGNPLQKYYCEKTYDADKDEELRIRKTCCFNYQLQGNSKRCKTCPCIRTAKDGKCFDGDDFCTTVRSFT
ncbi:siderophore-iron reductase FhuF [Bacillus salipaludis]|uniref:siderophore-iron reductase FhuF n=1 Tax=Bacillus salipaludis TaxID=2547811 RepID=UPI002E21DFD3|nr:siderophore-iron reductase FhuF [Bacillus salipaludis]